MDHNKTTNKCKIRINEKRRNGSLLYIRAITFFNAAEMYYLVRKKMLRYCINLWQWFESRNKYSGFSRLRGNNARLSSYVFKNTCKQL